MYDAFVDAFDSGLLLVVEHVCTACGAVAVHLDPLNAGAKAAVRVPLLRDIMYPQR